MPSNQEILTPEHRQFLIDEAHSQFDFFDAGKELRGGFASLNYDGTPIENAAQELHSTTRMIHSYSLGKIAGRTECESMIDHGMAFLTKAHKDSVHGGFIWSLKQGKPFDSRKLAYGHVFVLLAASSAFAADHPKAKVLLDEIDDILDAHFWDEEHGLFREEWNRDWSPFSTYRGMNANMHAVEALLSAFEVTGREKYLERAGRILNFFLAEVGPVRSWRLPEHYDSNWQIDENYCGDPMFRPAGTTPGHSFEFARLALQYNELTIRENAGLVNAATNLVEKALADAWDQRDGGLIYTLDYNGNPMIKERYWWPITEAIGAMAALLKTQRTRRYENWYQTLWSFAEGNFIDEENGGWFPEVDSLRKAKVQQFSGKPDIYHSIQATLFPLTPKVSAYYRDLRGLIT